MINIFTAGCTNLPREANGTSLEKPFGPRDPIASRGGYQYFFFKKTIITSEFPFSNWNMSQRNKELILMDFLACALFSCIKEIN